MRRSPPASDRAGPPAAHTMRLRTTLTVAALAASIGCSPARRHKVLTIFFDGVPPPRSAEAAAPAAAVEPAVRLRSVQQGTHGPYAARLCQSCHDASARNALVAPAEELCFRCHELPRAKKYVHGPLASGGCVGCHDPHSSGYRYLLVSESDGFCFKCHDRASVTRGKSHEGVGERCTTCHDAHMSDREYLLK